MTREEAKEIFDHNWTRLVNPDYSDEELGEAQNLASEALENIAAVKGILKGKWIPNAGLLGTRYSCSICGSWSTFNDNYCSNCGAEMIKGE